MSAVTPAVRETVLYRAMNRCERCCEPLDLDGWYSLQHRRPRGMGGTKRLWVNEPPNLIALCGSATSPDGCHHWAESQRREAEAFGYLLAPRDDPSEVPFMDNDGTWWLLRDDTKVLLAPDGVFSDFTTADDIGRMLTTVGGSS